jgi:hypothetical protein
MDPSDAFLNKIGGYNCALEQVLRTIERRRILARGYTVPLVSGAWLRHAYRRRAAFEVPIGAVSRSEAPGGAEPAFDVVMFATLENYVNAFTNFRSVLAAADDCRAALVVPAAGLTWSRCVQLARQGVQLMALETCFPLDLGRRAADLGQRLAARLDAGRRRLEPHLEYNGVHFGAAWFPVLREFVRGFVPLHVLTSNALSSLVRRMSGTRTVFCVARERRALESTFVHTGNQISGRTAMIMHGILTFDMEKRLFTGHFHNVARVYGWGQHDREMIAFRQRALVERMPEVVSRGAAILGGAGTAVPSTGRRMSAGLRVLFAAEPHTNGLIDELSAALPADARLIVRVHPSDRDELPDRRARHRADGRIAFDDGRRSLREMLAEADCFVSFSSTTVVEALWARVPTIVLDYPVLYEKHPRFFREGALATSDTDAMFARNSATLAAGLQAVASQNAEAEALRRANEVVREYFIA